MFKEIGNVVVGPTKNKVLTQPGTPKSDGAGNLPGSKSSGTKQEFSWSLQIKAPRDERLGSYIYRNINVCTILPS